MTSPSLIVILLTSCVISGSRFILALQTDLGLCSQVYQMHQYCTSQGNSNLPEENPDPHVIEARIGKAGPRGPPGRRGQAGFVNYTEIFAKMDQKFNGLKAELDEKTVAYDKMVEETNKNRILIEELQNNLMRASTVDCSTVDIENAKSTDEKGGVFDIYRNNKAYEVYCDLTTDDGGWIVFQRRSDGSENFYRSWDDYANGFGNKSGEFWLGLDTIHTLMKNGDYELRIDLLDKESKPAHAKYSTFSIGSKSTKYKLTIGGYTGTAGDSMTYSNGMPFSTRDQDNDSWGLHCADFTRGGWWFKSCMYAHLNGKYDGEGDARAGSSGVYWHHWKGSGYSLKGSVMMFRRK